MWLLTFAIRANFRVRTSPCSPFLLPDMSMIYVMYVGIRFSNAILLLFDLVVFFASLVSLILKVHPTQFTLLVYSVLYRVLMASVVAVVCHKEKGL